MAEPTLTQRLRATTTANSVMIEALWVELLRVGYADPGAAADHHSEKVLEDLERLMALVRGEDADVTQHLAIGQVETMWRTIRTMLKAPVQPRPDPAPARGKSKKAKGGKKK